MCQLMKCPGQTVPFMRALELLEGLTVSPVMGRALKMMPLGGTGHAINLGRIFLGRIQALLLDRVSLEDQIRCLVKQAPESTPMLLVGTGPEMFPVKISYPLELQLARSHSTQELPAQCHEKEKNHPSLKLHGTGQELSHRTMCPDLVLTL